MLITIPADTNAPITSIEATPSSLLTECQRLVGGYVEVVPFFGQYDNEKCIVLCDEEGKLKGKPLNARASVAWLGELPPVQRMAMQDFLVGDIVVLTGRELAAFTRRG